MSYPTIARRDIFDGKMLERNRGTPQCARIGQFSMEDETGSFSLQDEDRQDDHEVDVRPTITPQQEAHPVR